MLKEIKLIAYLTREKKDKRKNTGAIVLTVDNPYCFFKELLSMYLKAISTLE